MAEKERKGSDFWDLKGVISLAALVLSLVTLWVTNLAPFKPHIVFERVVWHFEEFKEPQIKVLALANTIQLTNSGAQPGCIVDVVLDVSSASKGTRWRFYPSNFVNLTRFFQATKAPKSFLDFVESEFYPLFVSGRQQIARAILFLPADPSSVQVLSTGEYVINLMARRCGAGRYEQFGQATYILTENSIKALREGHSFVSVSKEVEIGRPR